MKKTRIEGHCGWLALSFLLLPLMILGCHSKPVEKTTPSTLALAETPQTTKISAFSHPRLFIRESDLPRLRSWATPANPIYEKGIKALALEGVKLMDSGALPSEDKGNAGYAENPTESYAMLFALLSLVDSSPKERADYAQRARSLLMHAIGQAALGPAPDKPFRDPRFSIGDRSRWDGAEFPLAVDWIYPQLTREDKAQIRKVFLRWAQELEVADTTDNNHPEPLDLFNDPRLLSDPRRVRWAANNYFSAHARNLGLISLALDPADDPGGELGGHLRSVTGRWLYVSDALWRGDMRGGMAPEGFEYSPQAVGYIAQLLLALHTSGRTIDGGKQATFENPFWEDLLAGYFHSLAPKAETSTDENFSYLGPLYSVAWYGDGQRFYAPDFMGVFGPLGLYSQYSGNEARLRTLRWIQTHLPPGGASRLVARAGDSNDLLDAIFYFLLFDPNQASPQEDPRTHYPLHHFARGIGRFLQRTAWDEGAAWFSYKLGWASIDHQHGDGNMFEFWRKGEWLTKERTGYGEEVSCTDQKNGVAIQNDPTEHDHSYLMAQTTRGSQRTLDASGDGKILAARIGDDFTYFLGDATDLYNSVSEGSNDVLHASRSIVWLLPDRILVYDRAVSKSENRFKRFFLQLPAPASVAGDLMTMKTAHGQNFYVRNLLPSLATMTVEKAEPLDADGNKQPADLDPIRYRLRVEARGNPRSARFLHVLQGADASVAPDAARLITSSSGSPFQGAFVKDVVVLFPVDIGKPIAELGYSAPASAKAHLITGLTPNGEYQISVENSGDLVKILIKSGAGQKADGNGVLMIGIYPEQATSKEFKTKE